MKKKQKAYVKVVVSGEYTDVWYSPVPRDTRKYKWQEVEVVASQWRPGNKGVGSTCYLVKLNDGSLKEYPGHKVWTS